MADADRELPSAAPRSDALAALALMALGAFAAVAAWRMDRFTSQGGTLWTAPGLWPGIVALVLVALAACLALRSWMRGRSFGWRAALADDTVLVSPQRFAGAAAAFFAYALLLVGRGLPFWLGTAIFVAGYVYLFHLERDQRTPPRRAMLALVIGTVTALVVTLVFERVFLVRLP